MKLEKLKILVEESLSNGKPQFDTINPIEVLFNPNRIEISKIGWKQGFGGTLTAADQPATLSVELFFDTSLVGLKSSDLGSLIPTIPSLSLLPDIAIIQDVRNYTKQIYSLTEKKGILGNRPPICKLVWGTNTVLFQGVLKQLTKSYTRFLEDGKPVRATLNCSFEEWEPPETKQKKLNPIDDPIRIVKRGETLSSIAAEEYNDPSLWRVIATANKLNNPRRLTPGQSLIVPPLPANSIT
ncbi:CIS tube protein [Limnofasciculus baicalensis]|uniref:LysM peptidoglycan-binding domain-containing protein n=1 Tax=Limnofasciculus baicalensis BBK-W-15 TaxID=2699891 RepID=A0AAE3KS65_9CYAN|nr:LysM peptidoglycan-binding domain-containing protein [Limnofasciculus baicalensis]MCP2729167.1 LysM peptidoglycan-binding domain-containing protein [Limnofasciculus baicalensis BBK-W-15]